MKKWNMPRRAALALAGAVFVASAAPAQDSAPQQGPTDPRAAATQLCTTESVRRGKAEFGASDVLMREVKDTDELSGDRQSVRAQVDVVQTDSKGKSKTSKKTFQCDVRDGVVMAFKWK